MTIFGFTLWSADNKQHAESGAKRIGDELHGIADDLAEARRINREQMGLEPFRLIEPKRKAIK